MFATNFIFIRMEKKKKIVKKSRVIKVRNNGTMTESGFWGFIRSALRQKSRWWKPITQCKLNAKRPYTGPNKRQKVEYQCNECKYWFQEKLINVDHIKPAGSLSCAEDVGPFIQTLFCEINNLQCLCTTCHDKKTSNERKKIQVLFPLQ